MAPRGQRRDGGRAVGHVERADVGPGRVRSEVPDRRGLRPTNQNRAASGCAAFGYGVRWTRHVPAVDLACTWLAIQAYSHLRADWDGPSANPQSSINLCLYQQAASE
jgi:hypothetical protein